MSTWLYQFWVYAFKTAKYWGRGPRDWTLDLLRFEQFKTAGLVQSPRSPVTNFETMVRQHFHSVMPQSARRSLDETSLIAKPSPLCRWSIHYSNNMKYEACKTRTPSPERDRDPLDEAAWRPWPSSDINPSMSQKLTVGLGSNHFSDVAAEDLPISLKKVARTLETADENFLEETLGFSIMARNFDMVGEILADWYERHCDKPMEHSETLERIRSVMPYHLAVTYLDGSKACCKVLDTLMDFNLNIRARDTNKFGHTVFDCLMMTILKAHTKVTPGELDDSLRDEKSFPGEEVDICGRFDADSDNVRALVASGQSGIPFSWKHKFCHTSTQAICHCLQTSAKKSILIDDDMITDVPSGLFVKRCLYCGLKMQLLPLHTLVLVAFQLGQSGAKDEDLFGIIAILLCILRLDADPLKTADVSMAALFPGEGSEEADLMGCSHSPLRACQIVALAWRHVDKWSSKAKTGWAIFFHILRIAEHTWSNEYELTDHECESYERECYKGKCFEYESDACLGRDKLSKDAQLLGLWAAVQTEILTYRRLREEDPWVSPFFDMLSVLRSLETGEPLVIELIRKDMIKPLCEHGWFHSRDPWCPRAEDVMKYHFSNLEDWFRTTFIRLSDLDLGEALFCFEERKRTHSTFDRRNILTYLQKEPSKTLSLIFNMQGSEVLKP